MYNVYPFLFCDNDTEIKTISNNQKFKHARHSVRTHHWAPSPFLRFFCFIPLLSSMSFFSLFRTSFYSHSSHLYFHLLPVSPSIPSLFVLFIYSNLSFPSFHIFLSYLSFFRLPTHFFVPPPVFFQVAKIISQLHLQFRIRGVKALSMLFHFQFHSIPF